MWGSYQPPARLLAGLLAVLISPGCGDAVRELAPTSGDAAHRAGELLGSLAARFGPIDRSPRFDELRPRMLRASLVPSLVYDDRSLWTGSNGSGRTLVFAGTQTAKSYSIDVEPAAPLPTRAADYRGQLRLRGEGDDAYEWRFREDLAVGRLPLEALAGAADALLRVPERVSPGELAPVLREALPRTAAALGRLIRLRSVRSGRHAGITAVRLVAEVDPDLLPPEFERYARYLKRYAPATEFNLAARDALGLFWELDLRQQRFTFRFAVRDGSLAPLEGALRRLPDDFLVRTSFAMKSGRFVIGYRELQANVALSGAPGQVGFVALFLREPEWRLPPLAGRFLRSPLRQPFDGAGSELAMRFEESAAASRLVRDYRLRVRENWLLRWLGGRVGSAVGEFRREAEQQSDRFTAEALRAIRADLVATLNATTPAQGARDTAAP